MIFPYPNALCKIGSIFFSFWWNDCIILISKQSPPPVTRSNIPLAVDRSPSWDRSFTSAPLSPLHLCCFLIWMLISSRPANFANYFKCHRLASPFRCDICNRTAVRRHCADWYEIWALTDHESYYIKIELDLRKFSNGPFSETEKGFWVNPTPGGS